MGIGCCYFGGKIAAQVLIDNAVGGGKECKDMEDGVAFSFSQPVPICGVCREVDLFHRPERNFGFLIHQPDVGMVDVEEYEAMWVLLLQ